MNIVIPMAGRGQRFADQQITRPKPLIEVLGRPMLAWALQSLRGLQSHRHIVIALEEHERAFGVRHLLEELLPGVALELILIPTVTAGQLCTVLTAVDLIDNDEPVLIAPCDTLVISDLPARLQQGEPACAGIISVADLPGDRWSFARVNDSDQVVEVAEKSRISDHASTGLYYFGRGDELTAIGRRMIERGETTRGEYYVIPVYQHLINAGRRVLLDHAREVWDLGTPQAKAEFERRYHPSTSARQTET